MYNIDSDILIIGAGLTGTALLLALRDSPLKVTLVDNAPAPLPTINTSLNIRSIALSPSSQRILHSIGKWSTLAPHATPIQHIDISEQYNFGRSTLNATHNDALGYVLEHAVLYQTLHQDLPPIYTQSPLRTLDPDTGIATFDTPEGLLSIRAKCFIAADGSHSNIRRQLNIPYQKKAYENPLLSATVQLKRPHQGVAYERFTSTGPLALLPLQQDKVSILWSLPPERAVELSQATTAVFLNALQKAFGYRLGRFDDVGKRHVVPLEFSQTEPITSHRKIIFVGNAAHTLHPVAGQGFNLGLRDIATLAALLLRHGVSADLCARYTKLRAEDHAQTVHWTEQILNTFKSRIPFAKLARSAGLLGVDLLPCLQQHIIQQGSGYGMAMPPDFACGYFPGALPDER
ncbi:MAG: FAD-dependent monooxygenase [Legionellaceae bacterium]|nr:FAD-dependent monooxygenase [Legionellaceae bacterium]